MTKVLIFHPAIAPYRVDFFNALNTCFNIRVCLKYDNLPDQHFDNYQDILNNCSFPFVFLKPLLTLGHRRISSGIFSQIKEFKPDIVIGIEYSWEVSAILWYRKSHKLRFSVLTMSDDSIDMVSKNNDFSKIHSFMRKQLAPHLDGIILTSEDITNWYQNHFHKGWFFPIIRDEKKAHSDYSDAVPISNGYIKQYHLEGKILFLYVGRLVSIKRIDTIIEAFIKADIENSILFIIGSGEDANKLKKQAEGHDNIVFPGRFEGKALLAWYNIASTFILASQKEPFGTVTNEALLGGCNVLISKECGSSCLISEGENGQLFNSGDVNALTELMMREKHTVPPSISSVRPNNMKYLFSPLFNKMIREILNSHNSTFCRLF